MQELEERTGVNRETIRVYLRHGLLPEPDRPRRNAATYSEAHVQAIATIKRLQRDSRLTLPEIGDVMRGRSLDHTVDPGAFSQLERLLAAKVGMDKSLVPISSLIDRSAHAFDDAAALAKLGIVAIETATQGPSLSIPDAQLVLLWGQMRASGFVEDLNFAPDMLGFYTKASEFVAGWEARTFFERTRGRVDVDHAVAMLEQALPIMLNFFGIMRKKAFMRNIEREGAVIAATQP
jgi:DNA-binding transcriptional MerR regulator